MQLANVKHVSGVRWRREYSELARQTHDTLRAIRTVVSNDPHVGIDPNEASVHLWLLPTWYASTLLDDHSVRRAWADLSAAVFHRPAMIGAGVSRPDDYPASGRTWSIGKGLIGSAVFPKRPSENIAYILHDDDLGELRSLSWRQYRKIPDNVRCGRSRRDIRALCDNLGTAVAVGFGKTLDSVATFGCLTYDTSHENVLAQAQIERVNALLVGHIPRLVAIINDWGKYSPIEYLR